MFSISNSRWIMFGMNMEKNTPILKMTWSTSGRSLNCRQVLTSRGPWPLDTSTPHITGCSLWKTWKREDEITDQDKILQLIFVSKGGQCQKTNKKKESCVKVFFPTFGRNGWWVQVWFATWIHAPHRKGWFCSAANTICEGRSHLVWSQKYILDCSPQNHYHPEKKCIYCVRRKSRSYGRPRKVLHVKTSSSTWWSFWSRITCSCRSTSVLR